ncbi:hypothetical protein KUH03_39165 [Sphingobacterium sp. E70]|uniref:hypothetical protein n=1 Tax=Sphingobacterium sp. E70 TaxID=2853439 RepID=UPI00211D03BA|nr:hypothetical protein [Sphingobacterium sp. E70]ULT24848.1 hypothetical protein KUH03_39165 [Sphingobacterium sp. E70]
MKLEYVNEKTNGTFVVGNDKSILTHAGILRDSTINSIVFNFQEDQLAFIDEVQYTFPKNTVLPLMANQNFRFEHLNNWSPGSLIGNSTVLLTMMRR